MQILGAVATLRDIALSGRAYINESTVCGSDPGEPQYNTGVHVALGVVMRTRAQTTVQEREWRADISERKLGEDVREARWSAHPAFVPQHTPIPPTGMCFECPICGCTCAHPTLRAERAQIRAPATSWVHTTLPRSERRPCSRRTCAIALHCRARVPEEHADASSRRPCTVCPDFSPKGSRPSEMY